MAWKSFYLAAGMVSTAALPFYGGSLGAMNLPDGPCLIVSNHSSYLDGPLLALAYTRAKLKPLHMIAYDEPFHNWLLGWILRSGGNIPFKRNDKNSQAAMLRTALGWMAAGEAVGIFPEGHINSREKLNRPRPGAALLALESGMPIIPAAVLYSSKILPRNAWVPRLGKRVRVVFDRPLALFPKEMDYKILPRDERATVIKNLGYRIMHAIGLLSGRECRDPR